MFSVIIPTLWKSDKIKPLIQSLIDCELVNDITIISNERSELEKELLIYNTKLYIYYSPENLFVNESWNYGVMLADNDNVAILNDDILIDTNVFRFLEDRLYDVGVVGMCFENYALKQSVSMNLTDVVERPYGFGCAMFIHKPNYVNIPEELKIACGDDYLIKFAKGKAKKLYGCKIESDISTTTRLPEFGLIQAEDYKIFTEKYK
jgi:glycosyltransferase involved in cell wall biosynthesis